MRTIKPIKAYAVVSDSLTDFYCGNNEWALAVFSTRSEAIKFCSGCSAGDEGPKPHVIKVEINPL